MNLDPLDDAVDHAVRARVIGVETDEARLDLLSRGIAPFYEPGLERLLAEADRRMYSMKQIHHAEAFAREQEKRSLGASAN